MPAPTIATTPFEQQLGTDRGLAFDLGLVLEPVSRWPLVLPDSTIAAAHNLPVPARNSAARRNSNNLVSIVMLTFNGLPVTKLCLTSLIVNTIDRLYELIIVDNGSTDGTREYLLELARVHPRVKLIFNHRNRGFAGGNNQGLSAASGEFLVLLNNDTIVPPDWLNSLTSHLDDASVGLVGPLTNRCGNEAQIDSSYSTYGEFLRQAEEIRATSHNQFSDLRTTIMFCVAMRRDVFHRVGRLDEQFEIGMFEDDDYAMRVRAAGYRVGYANDVFIHHFGQASIGELAASGTYGPIFHANRERFERKWGLPWTPHEGRSNPEYTERRNRIRASVSATVPPGSTVVVASKGDDELVRIPACNGWHFPRAADGAYAGHHPADSASAIHELDALRAKGADFFVIPSWLYWWLDHYPGIKEHLKEPAIDNDDCLLFSLRDPRSIASEHLSL